MLKLLFPSILMLLLTMLLKPKKTWVFRTVLIIWISLFILTNLPNNFILSSFSINIDSISIILTSLTLWISSAIIIASYSILSKKNSPHTFLLYVILLILILLLAFISVQTISFYIYFEASLIPTLLLILGWGYQPERLQAGLYLILYTVTASLPLLFSIFLIFFSFYHLSFILPFWTVYSSSTLINIWWLFTIIAFLVKTPLFLIHLWLPKAHVEAPVAGSIILAGVLLKLGRYGLLRVSSKMIFISKTITTPIIIVCTIGGALARLICIRQTDVKSLIAYSSVSHIGLATGGIISNTLWGWQGAFAILIAHGFCSSCMFSLANITYETTQSRRIYVNSGLISMFPSLTFWWFCFSACNIAAPPSINLAREIFLISSNIIFSLANTIPIAIMAFIAAAYSLILYTSTQHGIPPKPLHPGHLFNTRNYIVSLIHLIPLILLISKLDPLIIWIWPYSWKTTLNCRFKSVYNTKA